MEELLQGSGCEHLYGGLTKSVAFVRKAMAKTKQINKGYKPPAQNGYDFPTATELDKPSKHIQINIGRVAPKDVVKHKYNRRKQSKLTAEEKEREAVMKPEYWGLSWDDFEEIDGNLVEKKHGLLWRPIYFKPAGSEKGCWGLRCCRYDKNGNTIPTNKKYEWIYFREQDDCGDVPQSAEKDIPTESNPPDEIKNETEDGDEIMLSKYFAKAKKNRFSYNLRERRKHPFFWSSEYYHKERIIPPNVKPTYKDIPVIISANRAMAKFIKTYQTTKASWGEPYLIEQQQKWGEHLASLERTDKEPDPMRFGKRGRPRTKERVGRVHRSYEGAEFQQEGTYRSTISNNKWGKAMAEKALANLEDRQDNNFRQSENYAYAIGANEALIAELLTNPDGNDLDYTEIERNSSEPDWGHPQEPIESMLEYNKEDAKKLMAEAEANR